MFWATFSVYSFCSRVQKVQKYTALHFKCYRYYLSLNKRKYLQNKRSFFKIMKQTCELSMFCGSTLYLYRFIWNDIRVYYSIPNWCFTFILVSLNHKSLPLLCYDMISYFTVLQRYALQNPLYWRWLCSIIYLILFIKCLKRAIFSGFITSISVFHWLGKILK